MRYFSKHRVWSVVRFAAIGALAVVAAAYRYGAHSDTPTKLNVVIVVSDALRAASLPMYGYPRETTPALTKLAREGILFDSHLVHYPGTSVSISQLHTGRLMPPLLMSYKYISVPVRAAPPDLLVLPEAFRQAGYHTGLISSHYWFKDNSLLPALFDTKTIVPATGDQAYAWFENLWAPLMSFLDETRQDGRPFFLYVHSLDTHGPNTYHSGFDTYRNAPDWPEAYNLYDSEIMYTDHWVGKLVDELRRRRLLDHTIFVFTSDHGEEFNELGPEKWNGNHGPVVRRNLMHVPLIMRVPNDPTPGRRYTAVTRHIDLAPTLLRLAIPGFDLQPYRVDGDDLSQELLTGGTGAGVERTSYAFSPRYWGLFQRQIELQYDQWSNTFSPLYKAVPDRHNYPMLEAVDDVETRNRLMEQLGREQQQRTREFIDLPENPHLPQPALLSLLLPVKPDSGSAPVFENLPDDNRWQLSGWLESQPTEHPAPVTLVTPWVAGTYRAIVQLHQPGIRQGYENRFTLYFPNAGNRPVPLSGADARDGALDAGVQEIGNVMEMQFSDPQGGVAIGSMKFERVGDAPTAATPDDALRERLRALGYVQ